MQASVRVRTPSGELVQLFPGDLVGRTASAALSLDDPRISEGHALVSLRGGALQLLSLRRMVAVDGRPLSAVELRPGLRVQLAEDLALEVVEVQLPGELPALALPDGRRRLLVAVASLSLGPDGVEVAQRYEPGADAHLWRTDEHWRLQRRGEAPVLLSRGDRFTVGPHALQLVGVPLSGAGHAATAVDGGVRTPLRIVACYDTVHLHRPARPPVTLGGRAARIITELAHLGGPVHWTVLAGEIWRQPTPEATLRHRLDVNLGRLRRRLRDEGIRPDLVHSDGSGQVELLLYEEDAVEVQD